MNVRLMPILLVNFVGSLGLSIVLPFLVFLVDDWGGNALIYGVISASYSAFQLLGAPILGRWSDRFGRRRVLLLSHGGTLLSWCVFFIAFLLPTDRLLDVSGGALGTFTLTLPLLVLFLARSLDGLTGGNVAVANAYLADISTEENRNANFGRMALSANLGFVVGPALAGLLGSTVLGHRLPVLAAIAVSATSLVVIYSSLPESRPKPTEMSQAGKLGLRQVACIPCVARLLVTHFVVMLAFHFFYAAFPMHAVRGLGWSARNVGLFFAALSLMMVLVQGPVLTWVSRRFQARTLVLSGLVILAASFWLFGSDSLGGLLTAAAGMALGNGIMWPSLLALLSKAAGPDDQGTVHGYASSGGALASIVGLISGGALFEIMGPMVFALAAVIFAVGLAVAVSLGRALGATRGPAESEATLA